MQLHMVLGSLIFKFSMLLLSVSPGLGPLLCYEYDTSMWHQLALGRLNGRLSGGAACSYIIEMTSSDSSSDLKGSEEVDETRAEMT